jgi:hypothetical protein
MTEILHNIKGNETFFLGLFFVMMAGVYLAGFYVDIFKGNERQKPNREDYESYVEYWLDKDTYPIAMAGFHLWFLVGLGTALNEMFGWSIDEFLGLAGTVIWGL